jgi:hypothetical protein
MPKLLTVHFITRKEKNIFKYLQQDRNVVQVSKIFANKTPQTFGKITVKMKQKMIKSQCQQALCWSFFI